MTLVALLVACYAAVGIGFSELGIRNRPCQQGETPALLAAAYLILTIFWPIAFAHMTWRIARKRRT